MVNRLLEGVNFLKSKLQTDELDDKLNQAVSEENWQASPQLLHEIANASHSSEKEQRIVAFAWEKLKSKGWKKVLKTLHLIAFMVKYAPTPAPYKEGLYDLRALDSYTLVEGGVDRGEAIRKQAREIVDLLSDDQRLAEERAKAKQIKERMAGVLGSAPYFGSFGSTAPTNGTKNGYEGYSNTTYQNSSNNQGSFGEQVMRSLHEQRGIAQPQMQVKVEPKKEEKPPAKLDLSKMNERKPEKVNPNQLKLVKPPEKKKVEQVTKTVQIPVKPASSSVQKGSIFDIDFNSQVQPQSQTSNQPISQPFDFLGLSTSPAPQRIPKSQKSGNIADFAKVKQPIEPIGQKQDFLFGGLGQNNAYNTQPQSQNAANMFFLPQMNPLNSNTTASTQQKISLQAPTMRKGETSSASSLIDFSNFREELSNIGSKGQQKSIVEGWNW